MRGETYRTVGHKGPDGLPRRAVKAHDDVGTGGTVVGTIVNDGDVEAHVEILARFEPGLRLAVERGRLAPCRGGWHGFVLPLFDQWKRELFGTYTASADIGLCIPENLGLSYFLSLPNKLFEYVAAGLPVIGSNFPEIANIIHEWHVGLTAEADDPGTIALAVRTLLDDTELYESMRTRCRSAAGILNWEKERGSLLEIVSRHAPTM